MTPARDRDAGAAAPATPVRSGGAGGSGARVDGRRRRRAPSMGCRGLLACRAGGRGQRGGVPDGALAAAGAVARAGFPARTAGGRRLLGDPYECRDGRRVALAARRAVRSRDARAGARPVGGSRPSARRAGRLPARARPRGLPPSQHHAALGRRGGRGGRLGTSAGRRRSAPTSPISSAERPGSATSGSTRSRPSRRRRTTATRTACARRAGTATPAWCASATPPLPL